MENSNGDIIIYQTEDGLTKIDVKIELLNTENKEISGQNHEIIDNNRKIV